MGTSIMESSKGKAAIPRIPVEPRQSHARISRACRTCRERKTKCDGGKPSCGQCLALNMACVYPLSRKEENKATLEQLMSQNEQYKTLLRSIADGGSIAADDIWQNLEEVRYYPCAILEQSLSLTFTTIRNPAREARTFLPQRRR